MGESISKAGVFSVQEQKYNQFSDLAPQHQLAPKRIPKTKVNNHKNKI